jgi:hypothetical protein
MLVICFGLCLCLTREQNASTTPTNENEYRTNSGKNSWYLLYATMLQAVVRKLKAGHDYLITIDQKISVRQFYLVVYYYFRRCSQEGNEFFV